MTFGRYRTPASVALAGIILFAAVGVHLVHPFAHDLQYVSESHAIRDYARARTGTVASREPECRHEAGDCPVCAFLAGFHTEPPANLSLAAWEIPVELAAQYADTVISFTGRPRLLARAPPA